MEYKTTIGLEIHVELKTDSKMFCNCKNDPLETGPNINVCPVCMAHPGTLPVINEQAINKVIKTGLAMDCQISSDSKFERKNYFYPDLPKGYQISQYAQPLCNAGFLDLKDKRIRIERIHLEEDTAKLIHKKDNTLVDFNRAGIPLMELVTEPDFENGNQVSIFAKELQLILRYLNVSDANMEKGQMRLEANISISKNKILGTKVEVKNLNSFRVVKKAIDYEIKRQTEVLDRGDKVIQETRGWDNDKTISQRSKEEAHDYRYFPEPDLPPLSISKEKIQELKNQLPELPAYKRQRFIDEYGLKQDDIEEFVFNKDLSEYFEQVVSEFREWLESKERKDIGEKEYKRLAQVASNYMLSDLVGIMGSMSVEDKKFLITAENFAEFALLVFQGEITSKIAKMVLKEMFEKGGDPSEIIKDKGLSKIDDKNELERVVQEIIKDNSKAVDDFKKGKQNALQFLIGQAMAKTKGRAKPEELENFFTKALK
ncbi:Asp-tRNA(Asn)/Glu-tRNA(Gln) amidotransferase subunit GatB [Patescibacteria group bacterium]|nr:Asp-tRNA(Asn)/Glu-tRNA(Gln) amidotransferase subunit GatB [Patescibacteria group bacterium]MBU4078250.1 Asp-tRNA(Asn)/Glu-tRNA(Gln) amidotransferase subunit GatB [Patescibacteria group bacterium]